MASSAEEPQARPGDALNEFQSNRPQQGAPLGDMHESSPPFAMDEPSDNIDSTTNHQRIPSKGVGAEQDQSSSRVSNEQGRKNSGVASNTKSHTNEGRRPSGTNRTCGKCGGTLTGQFVRALEDTFHLECFTCHDCGKIVASKFFPVPDNPPNQYPLCETDYFKRLDLICYECGGALRGSYITALERKYHIEHFTCSMCPTVFGAQDSYYEHEGNVYCHYHYSTKFAQKCNGCQTAILKQFVEIFRNGQNQHWHPECYMIHKYWNVRLQSSNPADEDDNDGDRRASDGTANTLERTRVRVQEEDIEKKVNWIWRTLSAYEEKSATCISDMLLNVSNGAYVDGVMSAKRFILHVDLLFAAADELDQLMMTKTSKGLSYSREAKLLCKKIVAFFQLLAGSQDTGVRRLGVTQELLSLVTGLAHYLKLLIRICLQGSLKFERDTGSEQALQQFLDTIFSLDAKLEAEGSGGDSAADLASYVNLSADTCPVCTKHVEDRCFRRGDKLFHANCMKCDSCQRDLSSDAQDARWDTKGERLLCDKCVDDSAPVETGFVAVTRLQQYVHLLRVAHARLLATLRTSGALPHTSDDPNLAEYDSSSGHRVPSGVEKLDSPLLRSDTRPKSYQGTGPADEEQPSSYEQTLGDIRRLRSTRMDKTVSNTMRRARTSRIIGDPDGGSVRPGSSGADGTEGSSQGFHIVTDRDASGEPVPQLTFGNQESIRLDDIPRIVAAEQAKDQWPNATKYARGGLLQNEPKPKLVHRRETSGAQELEKLGPEGHRPKKYFSELTALEYFIVRHVAVLSMEPLLEGHFNQEELLDLIEMRKPTFWGKFGKAFKNDKTKGGRKKGVFGVSIEQLVERDFAESTDGVGPGALRVPALVQDTVSAMRTMDMSMEGVFRKNGNIRRLKDMAELYDTKGGDAVDLNAETPVQVAALLKKFLRELPDPVMTYKLHRLFVISQKLADEEKRRRVLHLACCLLPKSHRDTMEVLFCFLNWAASFSVVDEESGSKMDIHNLATVIAPNILVSNTKTGTMEESFLAIEAIHSLIECNESMCEVPEDLQSILNDTPLFSSSAEITTKEILRRYGDIAKAPPNTSSSPPKAGPDTNSDRHRDSLGSSPQVTRIEDHDVETRPWHAETSVRPVYPTGYSRNQPTPPPGAQSSSTNGFYSNPTGGSRDSFSNSRSGSPSRWNRSGGQMGVT